MTTTTRTATATLIGQLDGDMMERQIRRAADIGGFNFAGGLTTTNTDHGDFCEIAVWNARAALKSAYRRGFGDAEDSIAAAEAPAPSTADEPDSTDSTDKLMASAYHAAADHLARAAAALTEAADAARAGKRNLATGTALGAEGDAAKAKALVDAMLTIARI